MGIREDIAAEVARQAEARGEHADRTPAAAVARRKFGDEDSTPEALEQWDRSHGQGDGDGDFLYKGSAGGKSRLGSLPSSDAELERLAWRPAPLPEILSSPLFGTPWNMRIGGG